MPTSRNKSRSVREQLGGVRRKSDGIGLQAKPGAPKKSVAKGGRDTTQRAKSGRSGAAKKGAGASQGTDRSRHQQSGKKQTRVTSLSPSLG